MPTTGSVLVLAAEGPRGGAYRVYQADVVADANAEVGGGLPGQDDAGLVKGQLPLHD